MSDRTALFYYVARVNDDGSSEPLDLTQRVKVFSYNDREGGMDKLTLTVDNFDLSNFDDPVFEQGAKLRVAWGNGKSMSPLRDMVVRKVVGGRELSVTAVTRDASKLDTVKKRRVFENTTRSDVVEQVAKENGFIIGATLVDKTPIVYDAICQGNLTDGEFLRKLASLEGFEFFVDHTGVNWKRRRVEQAPIRVFTYYTDPEGGEILDFNIENDVTRRPGKITVKARDPLTKEDISVEVSNTNYPDRPVLSDLTATIDGETGEVTGQREIVHEVTTLGAAPQSAADAEVQAKAAFRAATQGVVKMTLTLRGDPSFVAKSVVEVRGMGKRLSGKYYVKEVTHTLDSQGGYGMVAKLITDGFQNGGGRGASGGGADAGGDPSATLVSVADALEFAASGEISLGIDGETGALQGDIAKQEAVVRTASALADALRALSTQQGDQLARNAVRAVGALQKLASNARAVKMRDTTVAATNAAARLNAIIAAAQTPANAGVKNTKTLNDSDVRPVRTLDEDGEEVTRYERTGGRE